MYRCSSDFVNVYGVNVDEIVSGTPVVPSVFSIQLLNKIPGILLSNHSNTDDILLFLINIYS